MPAHALQPLAHAIRFLSIDAIVRAGEGHQGVPLGMAEIATALYTRHLKFNAAEPTWWDRDRVVLSNGHGSMLLYALLYLTGYERISLEQIKTFRDARLALRRASGVRPRRRHRSHHRPARPGHRQRARHGGGRGVPERALRRRPGRSPHLRLRRRRLPAGRHRPGNDLAGRAPAPGQADLPVGRQPHHRRRQHRRCRSAKTWPRAFAWPAGMWWSSTATTSRPCRRRSTRRAPTRGRRCWPAAP